MIKNIIIGVLALFCVCLVVLAQLKSIEVEKANLRAFELSNIAEQNAQKALDQERIASQAAADAQRIAEDLRAELEKCKNGK